MSDVLQALSAISLSLVVTLCIEVPVAAMLGLRSRALGAVAAVNLVTNPALNLILLALWTLMVPGIWFWPALGFMEILVIVVEWLLLVWALDGSKAGPRRLLTTSVFMNLLSATAGTLLLVYLI